MFNKLLKKKKRLCKCSFKKRLFTGNELSFRVGSNVRSRDGQVSWVLKRPITPKSTYLDHRLLSFYQKRICLAALRQKSSVFFFVVRNMDLFVMFSLTRLFFCLNNVYQRPNTKRTFEKGASDNIMATEAVVTPNDIIKT